MACLKPITKQVRTNPHKPVYSIHVPCGKCINCLKRYQNQWYLRLSEEVSNYSEFTFFTLTYNEKAIPFRVDTKTGRCYNTVNKTHVQLWLKRLRTRLMRENKLTNFKYFITSEYGPRTLRPHYHGIIFGVLSLNLMQSFNEWSQMFGFYSYKTIPIIDNEYGKAIRYVSKYCSKGMFENPLVKLGLVDKTFHLISKGIGKSYVDKRKYFHLTRYDDISNNFNFSSRIVGIAKGLRVLQGNFFYAMPRYYKEKIVGNKTRLSSSVADFLLAQSDDVYNTELREFQLLSGLSEFEASRTLDCQKSEIQKYEARNALSTLGQFYNKSKL